MEEGEQDDVHHDLDGKLLSEKHLERKAHNDRDDIDLNHRGVFFHASRTWLRTTSISTVYWYLRGAPQTVVWFRALL